jgi:ParB family chromosome partitioning protein
LESTSERLNAELEALYDSDGEGDEHTAAVDGKEAECNAANEAFEAADEALKGYGPEALQHAGALVGIDRNGAATVHRGLVRPEDRRALALAVERAARAADGLADDLVDDVGVSGSAQHSGQADGEPKAKGLSEVLMRRLTAQRTLAIQAMLADNAQVALAALANVLVARLIEDDLHIHQPRAAVQISAQCSRSTVLSASPEAAHSKAFETLAERVSAWRDRIPGDAGRRLGWLIALPQSDLVDLLALCVALSTDAVTGQLGRHAADVLVAPLGLDMAEWWEPTAENYLAHVPKAKAIEAVAQACGAAATEPLSKLKKVELVVEAERLLSGSRWLPPELMAQGD